MNSRERIQRFLKGEKVDRIPNGLGGCETAGLHVVAYNNYKQHLGVTGPDPRLDTFMTNSVMEMEMLEKLECDLILLASPIMCNSKLWGPGYENQWKNQTLFNANYRVSTKDNYRVETDGTIYKLDLDGNPVLVCPSGGLFFDSLPEKNISSERIYPDDFNPPMHLTDSMLRELEESAKWLYNNTDYAIVCGETIRDLQVTFGGYTDWMIRMIEEPEIVREFLDKACEAGLSQLQELHQAIGKYTEILCMAHDFGDNRSVLVGENLWCEIYKPSYKKLFTKWHNITDMKSVFHSCGAISNIIGDLIECGVDILNPIQVSAKDMNPSSLIEKFGDKIIFYGGGFDSIQTPPETDSQKVYEQVKENILKLNEKKKYIFAGVHNIPGDVPVEHLDAMMKAYYEVR